jgi:hydrogenase-4 component B
VSALGVDPEASFWLVLGLRLLVAASTLALFRSAVWARRVAFLGSAVASAATGALATSALWGGEPVEQTLFLHRASGFALTYAVDELSAWFLLALSVLSTSIAVFSVGYVRRPPLNRRSVFLGVAFNLLIGVTELVFVASDVITFLFAWELMTLGTGALVATEHEERACRRAAYLYLVMSHLATGCLMASFWLLASASGSLAFPEILSGGAVEGPLRVLVFALFLLGFATKAGVVPLHVWLPEAHPAAPSNVSALMSSILIKTGIYGIVRFCAFGLGTPELSWGVLVVALGGLSALLGVLYALMQHDLKRLLAYHSIENIGIILLGLGAGMISLAYGRSDVAAVGVAACLYHVLNHAVFKGLLFLGAGGVAASTGTRQLEELGGLLRRMPWTGLLFLVGAMAISGLPPLNGFASEWLTFQAFLFGFRGSSAPLVHILFPLGGALLALTTALAAACFVKAFGIAFLALPRSPGAADARESDAVMLAPQAVLAALSVLLGLLPGVVLRALASVAGSLPGLEPRFPMAGGLGMTSGLESFDRVVPLILLAALFGGLAFVAALAPSRAARARRVATWGCGGELGPRTEYTATAFSKPLMMVFRAVYRPMREVETLADVSPYFPREVRYRAEIEPTFERYVYRPLLDFVLRIADGMKVLQAGSLHAYLAYVTALVVGLVLLVWWTR